MDVGAAQHTPALGRGRARWLGLIAVYLALVLFPGGFSPLMPGADGSAYFALNYLSQSPHRFGPDAVCVYGPLGHLLWPHDFGPNLLLGLAFRFSFLALFLFLFLFLVRKGAGEGSLLARAAGFAAVTALAVALGLPDEHHFLLVVLLLVLAVWRGGRAAPALGALTGLVLGVLLFVKINLAVGALGVGLVAGAALLALPPRRPAPVLAGAAVFLVVALGLGIHLCGSPGNLILWVRGTAEILHGFSGAMPYIMPSEAMLLTGVTVTVFFVMLGSLRRMGAVPVLSIGVLLLYGFKHAYVGHFDGYFPFLVGLAATPILFAPGPRGVRTALAGAGVLFLLSAPPSLYYHHRGPGEMAMTLSGGRGVDRAVDLVRFEGTRRELAAESRRALGRNLLSEATRRRLTGNGATVSVLPMGLSYIAANDLRWSPMPTLQAYGAYTAGMDRRCAGHFRSPRRPDYLLVEGGYVQRRNMVQDAPEMWRAIRERYAVAGWVQDGALLLLEARPEAGRELVRERGAESIRFRQWVDVPPAAGCLYLSLDVSRSAAGEVMGTLLNLSPLEVEIETEDGARFARQLVVDTARNGFLVSPVVESQDDLAAYLEGCAGRRARRIRVAGEGVVYYRPTIRLRWLEGAGSSEAAGAGASGASR